MPAEHAQNAPTHPKSLPKLSPRKLVLLIVVLHRNTVSSCLLVRAVVLVMVCVVLVVVGVLQMIGEQMKLVARFFDSCKTTYYPICLQLSFFYSCQTILPGFVLTAVNKSYPVFFLQLSKNLTRWQATSATGAEQEHPGSPKALPGPTEPPPRKLEMSQDD